MRKQIKLKNKQNSNKGITLIALVITIIVLLILATISIATLTGENGILTKANIAKEEIQRENAREKVQMAVLASYERDGEIDNNSLKINLDKVEGIENVPETITDSSYPITVRVDGYNVIIDKNGKVTLEDGKGETEKSELEKAKESGEVLSESNPTTIIDRYGNQVVVPEGFKIAEDSATDVTGGVVIEDVSNLATAGSQFVWIPVGEVKTASESKTIELKRYAFNFNEEGTINEELTKTEPSDRVLLQEGSNIYPDCYFIEGLKDETTENTHAKDIETFRIRANNNHGYYIGRYEARTETKRTEETEDNELNQVTVKEKDYVYNYVTQAQAAKLAREMYSEEKTFTSDLINSYAWSTAIVFIQTFGKSNYSNQISLNDSFAEKGTNYLTDSEQQDRQCNIWDMASNVCELTTETANLYGYAMWTGRGGGYGIEVFWAGFGSGLPSNAVEDAFGFRLVIYL